MESRVAAEGMADAVGRGRTEPGTEKLAQAIDQAAPKAPKATFSSAARRGIPSLLKFLGEDVQQPITELPDRKGHGGHPMYRRLNKAQQKDLQRLVRWLDSKKPEVGTHE